MKNYLSRSLSLWGVTLGLLFGCAIDPRGPTSVAEAPGASSRDQQQAEFGKVSSIESIALQGRALAGNAIEKNM